MGCLVLILGISLVFFVVYLFTVSLPLGIAVTIAICAGSYLLLKYIMSI